VFSGMIAPTSLAVLFVPSFFTTLQRFEEWRKSKKKLQVAPAPSAEPGPPAVPEKAAPGAARHA
jgi:HAE1 family hydrophobic/amphiphilic exporter-1